MKKTNNSSKNRDFMVR